VVSSLLMQIDDLPPHVVVATATNHPELLDRAVWRRFQLRLELPPPTRKPSLLRAGDEANRLCLRVYGPDVERKAERAELCRTGRLCRRCCATVCTIA